MDAKSDHRGAQRVVSHLFLLMRTTGTHGPRHALTRRIAGELGRSILDAGAPLELQFVGQAMFRDRSLVPLDYDGFERATVVAQALAGLGAQEIAIEEVPRTVHLLRLAELLSGAEKGKHTTLPARDAFPHIQLRPIPGVIWGKDAEAVEPDIFCAAQLALAIAKAEALAAELDTAWDWVRGMSVLRRIDSASQVSLGGFERALEIAPGCWSPARQAVSAAFRVGAVCHWLELPLAATRVAAHAALAMVSHGIAGGGPVGGVAARTLARLVDSERFRTTRLGEHELRVCALLHHLARANDGQPGTDGCAGLVRLVYELERLRCPEGVDFTLSFGDLLAHAVEGMGRSFSEDWVRALVSASGQIPAGATVALPDGSVGIVLERVEGGDPLRPRVLVEGSVLVPDGAVVLVSPMRHAAEERRRAG